MVVFIDADGRFDPLRMRQILLGISESISRTTDDSAREISLTNPPRQTSADTIIAQALSQILVNRPNNTGALVTGLRRVKQTLLNISQINSRKRLGLICIDSIGAFVRQDRAKAFDELREDYPDIDFSAQNSSINQRISKYVEELYTSITGELEELQEFFGCTIVVSNQTIYKPRWPSSSTRSDQGYRIVENQIDFGVKSEQALPQLNAHMPYRWNNFFDIRLGLARRERQKLEVSVSSEEAFASVQEGRFNAQHSGLFDIWLLEYEQESQTMKRVRGAGLAHRFRYAIKGAGLEIIP